MGTAVSKYTIETLTNRDKSWFINVAAINMLKDELKRPDLINIPQLYLLTDKVIQDETAFVVKYDGECIGALAATLVPNMYNPDFNTFAELFWYVLPEYRNTRAGFLLISAFDKKGQECADSSAMSLLNSSEVNIETMTKRGYSLTEFALTKEHRRS